MREIAGFSQRYVLINGFIWKWYANAAQGHIFFLNYLYILGSSEQVQLICSGVCTHYSLHVIFFVEGGILGLAACVYYCLVTSLW